mmetsp:Transcript_120728/g.225644  ORF Transcript_120728/g.225644 Transcript_120728/m.225644 type:complete len:205 (-) Transcript_120728:1443-2057(-)
MRRGRPVVRQQELQLHHRQVMEEVPDLHTRELRGRRRRKLERRFAMCRDLQRWCGLRTAMAMGRHDDQALVWPSLTVLQSAPRQRRFHRRPLPATLAHRAPAAMQHYARDPRLRMSRLISMPPRHRLALGDGTPRFRWPQAPVFSPARMLRVRGQHFWHRAQGWLGQHPQVTLCPTQSVRAVTLAHRPGVDSLRCSHRLPSRLQ